MTGIRFIIAVVSSGLLLSFIFIDAFWAIYWMYQQPVPPDSFDAFMDSQELAELEEQLRQLDEFALDDEGEDGWNEIIRPGEILEL